MQPGEPGKPGLACEIVSFRTIPKVPLSLISEREFPSSLIPAAKDSRAIRVLFIDHTARLSGGEIALQRMIQSFDRARVDPYLLLFEEGPLAENLKNSLPVIILPLQAAVSQTSRTSLGWKSLFRLASITAVFAHIYQVGRRIRQLQPDLVHTNSLKSDIIGGIAARLAGYPVIWHVRDRIADDYLPPAVCRVFRMLSKFIPTFVIAVSDATLQTLFPKEKSPTPLAAEVIYDGVDLPPASDVLSATPAGAAAKATPRIGLIGRICPWKGQHTFLHAAALVHAEFPQARFDIVGGPLFGELDYERQMHELSCTLQLHEVVTFTGFVNDVPARIHAMDLIVHASTIAEPFGLVILEGMAQAKPVVATRGGGVLEIVVDGVTGVLVPMDDPAALARAILGLLRDPEKAAQMGAQGRTRVRNHFTLQQTARHVEDLYNRLVHQTSAASPVPEN